MIIKLYPENPSPKHLKTIADCLRNGGVIIYPTDTIYGFACDSTNAKAASKIAQIKKQNPKKSKHTLVFENLSQLSQYTKPLSNPTFKLLKKAWPGPYTFILEANNKIPKSFLNKKKQIGARIPDNLISTSIVKELGEPLLSTSVKNENDEILEYIVNPELIYEKFKNDIDILVDGGYGSNIPSTIIDCTTNNPEILREGKGNPDILI
jgi:tRNA threonylcarbamoyl adenosine modification protein (Sua5/YciO/YrdC/YwlC family)